MFLHDIVAPLTIDEAKATKTRLDPKCWAGKKIGNPKTKVKGGVRVNNCVPVNEDSNMPIANDSSSPVGGNVKETLSPDKNDPYEKGWRAGFHHNESNPYPAGSKEAQQWDDGYAEAEAQPNHYDEGVESDMPDLEAVGEPVRSIMDAERRMAAGDRIFAAHEMDEEPFEIFNVGDLRGYTYDQVLAVPQGVAEAAPRMSANIVPGDNLQKLASAMAATIIKDGWDNTFRSLVDFYDFFGDHYGDHPTHDVFFDLDDKSQKAVIKAINKQVKAATGGDGGAYNGERNFEEGVTEARPDVEEGINEDLSPEIKKLNKTYKKLFSIIAYDKNGKKLMSGPKAHKEVSRQLGVDPDDMDEYLRLEYYDFFDTVNKEWDKQKGDGKKYYSNEIYGKVDEDPTKIKEARPDVMRHTGDKTVRVVKKGGKPIGEIGTDAEASPGNGPYYVKLYDGSYDAVGFDTAEEALAELKYAVKQMAEGSLTEFAPSDSGGGGDDDGFDEDTLRKLAAQWFAGDEDPQVERLLAAAGWEIGQDEGYDDEPGVFVVLSGDDDGRSYMSWPAEEMRSAMSEGKKRADRYHIVGKDGKPASLVSYADQASAVKDRDAKYPGAKVHQVGPRGKIKSVSEVRAGIDDTDTVGFSVNSESAYTAVMKRFGNVIDHDETSGVMYAPARIWPKIEMVAFDADGEGATRDDGIAEVKHFKTSYGYAGGSKPSGGQYRHPEQTKADSAAKKTVQAQQKNKQSDVAEADRNEMDTPEFQAAIAKMKARHAQDDQNFNLDKARELGKKLAARGAAERKTKGVDEDSWHDGKNAWSSENNQWSNESVEDRRLNRLIEYRLAEMRRAGYDI